MKLWKEQRERMDGVTQRKFLMKKMMFVRTNDRKKKKDKVNSDSDSDFDSQI